MLRGVNVDPVGLISAAEVNAVGADAVRFVLTPQHDLREWCLSMKNAGVDVLAVLASESDAYNAMPFYVRHYGDVVDYWQVGNEPDQPGFIASWAMGVQPWCDLGRMVRGSLRGADINARVIGGGLTSGNVRWVPADALGLVRSTFDAISVHPYTQSGVSVKPLLAAYSDWFQMPIHVTEIGVERPESGDETEQAAYLTEMYGALDGLGYIESCFWFCMHDYLRFGLYGEGGRRTESWHAYRVVARSAPALPMPEPPSVIVPPVPQPAPPSDWHYHVGHGIASEMGMRGDTPATSERYVGRGETRYSEAYGSSGRRYVYLPGLGRVFAYSPD